MKIGILGSGQLARMLALSGYPLGFRFACYGPDQDSCGADLMPYHPGRWDEEDALWRFAEDCDVITIETENIPSATVKFLESRGKLVAPNSKALEKAQDRLFEKNFFRELGIPTAEYYDIDSRETIEGVIRKVDRAHYLKTRKDGYDGKNQSRIEALAEVEKAWTTLKGKAAILEEHVNFEREASLISVRGRDGAIKFYPLTENVHKGGILLRSALMKVESTERFQSKAEVFARRVMEKLDYVGVLTIEFFVKGDELIANEMAPRVHNSGHWTIDAAMTSQFENHLRAITGLPLGQTSASMPFAMFNLLGKIPDMKELALVEGLRIHSYRKLPQAGRKLGHLTYLSPTEDGLRRVDALVAESRRVE